MSNQILLPAILLIICSCFIGCKKESNSPPTDEEILGNVVKPEIIDEYIYPVKPDTPEWAALGSHDEMVDVLQLPDPALQKISTWGLAQTCFKYPLWSDYSVQNNEDCI